MAVKKNNTLFSYIKGNTVLHRIPAGIKLMFLIILCITVFAGRTPASYRQILEPSILIRTGICFTLSIIFWFLSGFKTVTIRNTKFVLLIGLLLLIFRFAKIEPDKITIPDYNGIAYALFFTLRFFIATLCAQCVFQTTSSLQIQECFENIEAKFAKIIPSVKKLNLALTLSIAINFIPQIFSTWNKISLAANARGPQKKSFSSIVRSTYHQFSALFSCMLKQAEEKRRAIINRM